MTVYEQIQKSLEFIDGNLFTELTHLKAARSAFMSPRAFYNYFWAVTGYTYKEYVRRRRLAEALKIMRSPEKKVLEAALEIGYESHESFTRAFRKEFGITPIRYRKCRQILKGLAKIKLIKEMYMGVIVKELPEMRVASFEGFAPQPELKASAQMKDWIEANGISRKPRRIFGHNIDAGGKLSYEPHNLGYKFMVTIGRDEYAESPGVKFETIRAGRYLVTGIEGGVGPDGGGAWIGEGWGKLNKMIAEKGYKVKQSPRWFEEELEPSKPGNLRLDLYLEIE